MMKLASALLDRERKQEGERLKPVVCRQDVIIGGRQGESKVWYRVKVVTEEHGTSMFKIKAGKN